MKMGYTSFDLINDFFLMQYSLFTFLEKVSKKRHPSRIAPLSKSFGMIFSFLYDWAIANKKLSLPVNYLLPAKTLCRLHFFFFGYFPFFFVAVQKEKSNKENLSFKIKLFEENK